MTKKRNNEANYAHDRLATLSDKEVSLLFEVYSEERIRFLSYSIAEMVLTASYDNFNYEGEPLLNNETFLKTLEAYKNAYKSI